MNRFGRVPRMVTRALLHAWQPAAGVAWDEIDDAWRALCSAFDRAWEMHANGQR